MTFVLLEASGWRKEDLLAEKDRHRRVTQASRRKPALWFRAPPPFYIARCRDAFLCDEKGGKTPLFGFIGNFGPVKLKPLALPNSRNLEIPSE